MGQELLLPAPLVVFERLCQLAATAEFWQTSELSLIRIFSGILAGTAAGLLFAWLTKASAVCDWILTPMIKIVRATPVVSFIILVMLWVTRIYVPGLISAMMVMPVIWGNVSEGIRETDKGLLETAKIYRFGRLKTLRLVYIPSVAPYFSSGLKTSLGLAWKSGVAAEVLCLPRPSIGTELYNSKLYLETPSLFAWSATVIVLSYVVEKLVALALGRLNKRRRRAAVNDNA